MPALAQTLAVRIVQFGRERALAHAGRIGLDDAQHVIDRARPDAHARRRLPGDHVGRGHKGIGAEVDVQQRALRPFEQDAFARLALFVQHLPDGGGIFQNLRARSRVSCAISASRSTGSIPRPRRSASWCTSARSTRASSVAAIGQIGHADRRGARPCPRRPGRCRARWCRSWRTLAASSRARSSSPWIGRISGVFSAIISVSGVISTPCPRGSLDLLDQMPRVQHDAVADHRQLAAAHHARGQRVQLVDLAVDHQRVARIVPALKARDHIGALGQPVDDLALALVAPLGARRPPHLPLPVLLRSGSNPRPSYRPARPHETGNWRRARAIAPLSAGLVQRDMTASRFAGCPA